jgi:23S rRNA pseudouridine2605 synthase
MSSRGRDERGAGRARGASQPRSRAEAGGSRGQAGSRGQGGSHGQGGGSGSARDLGQAGGRSQGGSRSPAGIRGDGADRGQGGNRGQGADRGQGSSRRPAGGRADSADRGQGGNRSQGADRSRGGTRSPSGGRAQRPPAAAAPVADLDLADEEHDSLIDVPGGVRLQKVLAAAGVGSRRHCEEMIGEGRVEVDGEIVRRYGARVDPQVQIIRVDGRRIPGREDLVYLALNKPVGVLTTMSDSRGRPTIADFLGDRGERLFHVGRLDYDTEGLMLLMNDGELAHRLAHPSFGVLKTYLADVAGPLPRDLGRQLVTGIELDDGVASADKFRVVERAGSRALVEITLHEGRKHIVRRMLAGAGHPVSRLVRTQVGPVLLGPLRPGTTRRLTVREIGELYATVGL